MSTDADLEPRVALMAVAPMARITSAVTSRWFATEATLWYRFPATSTVASFRANRYYRLSFRMRVLPRGHLPRFAWVWKA